MDKESEYFIHMQKFMNHVLTTICKYYKVDRIPVSLVVRMAQDAVTFMMDDEMDTEQFLFKFNKSDDDVVTATIDLGSNEQVLCFDFKEMVDSNGGIALLDGFRRYYERKESAAITNAIKRAKSRSW